MRKLSKADFFESLKNQSYTKQMRKVERKLEARKNEDAGVTELTIYGVIGDSWWNDSVSAADIDRVLNSIEGDILVHLNSPGGDAFDGIAIFNRLKKHDGKVTIIVEGWACSAASVIACAGDELIMGLGSMMMIHEASTIVWGTKGDMRKEASTLEDLEEGIIDIYMTKVNVTREEIRAMVDEETWFTAQRAVDIGFADKVSTDESDNKEDDEAAELKAQNEALKQELEQLKNEQNQKPAAFRPGKAARVF